VDAPYRTEARTEPEPQPPRMSHSTAHGTQLIWPLDYMGRWQRWVLHYTILH